MRERVHPAHDGQRDHAAARSVQPEHEVEPDGAARGLSEAKREQAERACRPGIELAACCRTLGRASEVDGEQTFRFQDLPGEQRVIDVGREHQEAVDRIRVFAGQRGQRFDRARHGPGARLNDREDDIGEHQPIADPDGCTATDPPSVQHDPVAAVEIHDFPAVATERQERVAPRNRA